MVAGVYAERETLVSELFRVSKAVKKHGDGSVRIEKAIIPIIEAIDIGRPVEEYSVEPVYCLVYLAVTGYCEEFFTEEESVSCLLAGDLA